MIPGQGRSRWWDAHAAAFIAEHPLAGSNWKLHCEDMKARRNAAIQQAIDAAQDQQEPPMTPEEEESLYAPEENQQTLF